MNEIVTRQDATKLGLSEYFTGKPCKHGHIAHRSIDNSRCTECKYHSLYREKRREWRKRPIERMKENTRKMAQRAIEAGKLKRQPCIRCGETNDIHAHHDDYRKPMEVLWLCPLHHKQRHKELGIL